MGKNNDFINAIKCGDIRLIKEELNTHKRSAFKAICSFFYLSSQLKQFVREQRGIFAHDESYTM
ncbi:hypothetical protein TrispH2_004227 [Trichoplax sp. H2]|nr:hypothetical protein TrispH2_004227 [Trichoplax sp. H2]|eukprot:RDD43977.1 hypothetical protein TrispH2_004227 [Trichoplax sp. H2]